MTKLKIEGMSCQHCVKSVDEALSEVPGVDRVVAVRLDEGEAEVEGSADHNALVAAVEEEGYDARVVQ
ncbi:CopZ family metallochaperone [Salinisphaera hydrothermalis]|uniref:Heavy metal transport/detoxification protein n=1 Tax=Salinisphaera hydrothermalis (strain C41B8) TaxID=1304275 RepID=A0A084IGJ2_SALHC|nr:cation transporter [Salinisphaera hydrothermalis]KEZ75826.1 heavy metal transport/detoxification protein [Salinisphaera hydrothermalis C41B8]